MKIYTKVRLLHLQAADGQRVVLAECPECYALVVHSLDSRFSLHLEAAHGVIADVAL